MSLSRGALYSFSRRGGDGGRVDGRRLEVLGPHKLQRPQPRRQQAVALDVVAVHAKQAVVQLGHQILFQALEGGGERVGRVAAEHRVRRHRALNGGVKVLRSRARSEEERFEGRVGPS